MEIKDTKIKNIIKCTAKAAITIEATISLTLFMFVVVFLAGFITAVDKQLSTQIKMNRLAENMAKQMFYIKQVDEITDYSEKLKEYKFDLENTNLKGKWIGIFKELPNGNIELDFTEEIEVKNFIMKLLAKPYLKSQQKKYMKDLEKELNKH